MNLTSYKNSIASAIIKVTALLLMMGTTTNIFAQNNDRARTNIGLFYPLSSNGSNAPRDTNTFSFNLIAGVSAAEQGFTLAGFSNVVHHNARGFQIAGFSNHIGNNADGVMVAGFLNTYGGGNGAAIAGFANIARNSSGTQVAGFLNKGGDISSLQFAGFMNVARDLKGTQVAGFLNIAKKSKGTQIGFINIADSAGTQLGIINLAKNGEKSFGLSIDETQTTIVSFRSGGNVFYGIVGVGYNFNNKKQKYAYQAGIGAHVLSTGIFRLKTELISSGLESFKGGEYLKSSFYLLPALKITKSIEIFAGPSFNFINTDTVEGRNMIKNYVSSWTRNNDRDFYGFYFGYTAGIQVHF
jgi:hypothetical protein